MNTLIALVSLLAVTCGCVRSLHPVYTDEDVIHDPAFVGSWTEPEGDRMDVTAGEDGVSYRIAYTESEGSKSKLTAYLSKLNERLIVDVTVDDLSLPEGDMYRAHLLPVHSFYFVRIEDKSIVMQTIDADWMTEYLQKHPDAIAHQKRKDRDDVPLLTAPTAEMRAFLTKIVKEPGALSEPATWTPASNVTTQPATQPKE